MFVAVSIRVSLSVAIALISAIGTADATRERADASRMRAKRQLRIALSHDPERAELTPGVPHSTPS